MKTENDNIERMFSEAFEGHAIAPEQKVLRNIRFRLWKQDFFSTNFRKFNFVYAAFIVVAGILIPISLEKQDKTLSNTAKEETKEESVFEEKPRNGKPEVPIEEKEKTSPEEKEPAVKAVAKAKFKPSVKEGCAPLSVKFENYSENASSYSWEFGDGKISKEKTPVHTYEIPGEYSAKLVVNDLSSNKIEYKLSILVYGKPKSDFALDIDKSDINTKQIVFENKSVGAASYIWDFGDNSTESQETNAEHAYSEYKAYPVKLISVSEHGCSDTLTKTNKFIDKNYTLYFPLSFRPNVTGASNNGYYGNAGSESSIFYPQNNGVKEYKLTVFAPNGTKVFATNDIKQGWNGFYGGRMMPSGIYTYQADGVYPNGKSFSIQDDVKVIVESYHDNY